MLRKGALTNGTRLFKGRCELSLLQMVEQRQGVIGMFRRELPAKGQDMVKLFGLLVGQFEKDHEVPFAVTKIS